ncbi:PAS domain-containing sensor histidine kinase [Flexithrix dorotheae]|uniref:PAS domain-containing sensor histidine kinase n=1 Tax=Flexithrix dorotheae TaxID=70993 RepID=UPI00146A558E|nr:ATP-binding protein [Flexithrix dorotheae]
MESSLNPYSVLNSLNVGIYVLGLESRETKEFRNLFINDANSKIVGIDFKPFVGKTLRESFPDAYKHGLPDKYLEAIDKQEIIIIGDVTYGDDKIATQVFNLKVIPVDKKTVILLTENVSKLRKTQEELILKNKALEEKNKELEQFAYITSHDLQEPLRTISSFAAILGKNYKDQLDEKGKRSLNFIIAAADRMKNLIKILLDYSRAGQENITKKVDCNIICNNILDDLEIRIKESGAKIQIEKLPVVEGYETELRMLFQNLISNALKFKKPDVAPLISINAGKMDGNGHYKFCIKDNGIGIQKENLDKVFDIFQRLNHRNKYEGSGIGLAHCRKIVNHHKGKIWLESTPNEGSSFFFTLNL